MDPSKVAVLQTLYRLPEKKGMQVVNHWFDGEELGLEILFSSSDRDAYVSDFYNIIGFFEGALRENELGVERVVGVLYDPGEPEDQRSAGYCITVEADWAHSYQSGDITMDGLVKRVQSTARIIDEEGDVHDAADHLLSSEEAVVDDAPE